MLNTLFNFFKFLAECASLKIVEIDISSFFFNIIHIKMGNKEAKESAFTFE